MSTLRANALEGVDAKNSITIVAGAGNVTTTNVQEGLNKCWINFDGSGTIATRDSFNVSGITDDSTGRYTVSINNDMSNNDYASAGIGNTQAVTSEAVATTGITLLSANASGSQSDVTIMATSILGDLA